MSGLGNKEIFSKNLRKYIDLLGKERTEIAKDLDVRYSTFTDWVNGNSYPRIDKIEKMANYFGIRKSDLIEEHKDNYYLNEESRNIANEILSNPDLKAIITAARDISPEDLLFVKKMLEKMKD